MKINQIFQFLFKSNARLSHRIISAGFWTLAMRTSGRGLGFVRIIVLAHLLTPEAFGLVGVGLLGIDLVMTLTSTGFNAALVQKKGKIHDYLDTAWVIAILRGLVMGGILFACSPLIARFFGSPEARTIVQVMASLVFIDGFRNSGLIYFQKELEIRKQFIFGMSQSVTDLAVTIPVAIILHNAWALVFGAIASNVVSLILSYVIHPYRPHFRFKFEKAKTLFNFGKWLTLSSWVNYASQKGDSILIGNLLGVSSLGLYQMARRISDVYSFEIYIGTMNVVFPASSKMQDNIPKLRQGFLLSMETVASLVFPLGAVIFMLAPNFVPVIFGDQWLAAIPAMKILGIAAAFQCLLAVGSSLFIGLGRPWLALSITVIATVMTFGLFFPLYRMWGLAGGATAVLIGYISPLPFLIYRCMKLLEIRASLLLRMMTAPLAISLAIIIVSAIATRFVTIQGDLFQLVTIFIVVGMAALGIAFLFWKVLRWGPFQVVNLLK